MSARDILVPRADLEALFAGFEARVWVVGAAPASFPKPFEQARDNLFRALHGDVQGEVIDAVAGSEQPPASSTHRATQAPGGLLPCWRCGDAVLVSRANINGRLVFFVAHGCHGVTQETCNCASESEAAAAWNHRAHLPLAAPSPLEAFEGAADVLDEHAVELSADGSADGVRRAAGEGQC